MADPLLKLREFSTRNLPIVQDGERIVFDDIAWPRATQTSYRSAAGGYYTLEALLFFLQNAALSHAQYVAAGSQAGVAVVSLPDRRDLLAYLRGEASTSSRIDPAVYIPPPEVVLGAGKHALEDAVRPDAKRARTDGGAPSDLQISSTTDLSGAVLSTGVGAAEDDEVAQIVGRERRLRTRVSVLHAPNKSFAHVLDVLEDIRKKDDAKRQALQPPSAQPAAQPQRREQAVYNRYDARAPDPMRDVVGVKDLAQFQIDTGASLLGGPARPQPAPAKVTPAPAPAKPAPVAQRPTTPSHSQRGQPSPRHAHGAPAPQRGPPIIIIPAVNNSLLTMLNVKDFLEGHRYVASEEKRLAGARRQNDVFVERVRGKDTVRYQIVDTITRLSKEDWKRVIAVFALGPLWQFKSWPWENPVDIFTNVKGFHLKFEDGPVDPNIKKWDVSVLTINRTKRHLDAPAALKFWEILDAFVSSHDNQYIRA